MLTAVLCRLTRAKRQDMAVQALTAVLADRKLTAAAAFVGLCSSDIGLARVADRANCLLVVGKLRRAIKAVLLLELNRTRFHPLCLWLDLGGSVNVN